MAICNNCGADMPEEGKFCTKCGTPREEQPAMETQNYQQVEPVVEPVKVNLTKAVVEDAPETAPVQFESEQGAFVPEQPVFSAVPTFEAQSAYEPIAPIAPAQQEYQSIPNGAQAYNPVPNGPRKSKKGPIIAIISIAVIAIAAIVVAIVMLLTPDVAEIDLTKYISIEYDGTDTDGTAHVSYDKTQLLIDILKEQGEDPSDAYSNKVSLTMNALLNSIKVEVSQTEDLSNGDKITVTIKYDSLLMEESDVEFTKESKEFTVENLTELIEVDPFEDIAVSFSGTSPDGYATVSNSSDIDCVRWAYFEFDKNDDLRNGDTITLSISLDDVEEAVEYGYKYTATSKTYTVEGLDYYYESLDQISDEHMKLYQEEAERVIADRVEWSEYYGTMTDIQCIGTYFAKYSEYQSNNKIIFVYTATLTSSEAHFDTTTIYIPVYMGVTKVTDGKLGSIYGSTDGYIYTEVGYDSFYGYVNGDVMYTQFILADYGEDYEVTASEGMPTFNETTDENILPAPSQASTEQPTEGTGESTTGEQTEEETTTKSTPGGIF